MQVGTCMYNMHMILNHSLKEKHDYEHEQVYVIFIDPPRNKGY